MSRVHRPESFQKAIPSSSRWVMRSPFWVNRGTGKRSSFCVRPGRMLQAPKMKTRNVADAHFRPRARCKPRRLATASLRKCHASTRLCKRSQLLRRDDKSHRLCRRWRTRPGGDFDLNLQRQDGTRRASQKNTHRNLPPPAMKLPFVSMIVTVIMIVETRWYAVRCAGNGDDRASARIGAVDSDARDALPSQYADGVISPRSARIMV